MRRCLITSALLTATFFVIVAVAVDSSARAASTQTSSTDQAAEEKLSPDEKMRRRFPQPARVRDLIGRPVLDWRDNTLGHVQQLVRTREGKIELIVRYGGWFGWIGWWQRSVAVPLEAVALIGPNVAALDMTTRQFREAPTWQPSTENSEVRPDEMIQIAISRR
jgi:PRC-barrel domain